MPVLVVLWRQVRVPGLCRGLAGGVALGQALGPAPRGLLLRRLLLRIGRDQAGERLQGTMQRGGGGQSYPRRPWTILLEGKGTTSGSDVIWRLWNIVRVWVCSNIPS